ncbi:MAG: GTPase [Deltaproteobacteria bacterium]|nr:GTPase [Deltaproteobacteria bacterium]
MRAQKVLILGAAGRDFHNFNMVFRDNPDFEVVAFTATQIPRIDGRMYPAALAGALYPDGIPILPEVDLERIVAEREVDVVVFAYSDVSHEQVMHLAARSLAAGAEFRLLGDRGTFIEAPLPVIAVCAARTGCGKSQTSRKIASILRGRNLKVSAIRHPMPYGDLIAQRVQRFGEYADLVRHKCTIEEIEEYEQYIERGMAIYAGVDYEAIVDEAAAESDVIIWDGGNNDIPFVRPDLYICVLDPLRPGHELKYYPGEVNLRAADLVVINKVDQAAEADLAAVVANVQAANPGACIIEAESRITLSDPKAIAGRRVLVVEDGPTLTHGGMSYGAGYVAAVRLGASEIIDPRPFAEGPIRDAYASYPHMGSILPALGYYPEQLQALEATIRRAGADVVIVGTPVDLRRYVKIDRPAVRVTYELEERPGQLTLEQVVERFLDQTARE